MLNIKIGIVIVAVFVSCTQTNKNTELDLRIFECLSNSNFFKLSEEDGHLVFSDMDYSKSLGYKYIFNSNKNLKEQRTGFFLPEKKMFIKRVYLDDSLQQVQLFINDELEADLELSEFKFQNIELGSELMASVPRSWFSETNSSGDEIIYRKSKDDLSGFSPKVVFIIKDVWDVDFDSLCYSEVNSFVADFPTKKLLIENTTEMTDKLVNLVVFYVKYDNKHLLMHFISTKIGNKFVFVICVGPFNNDQESLVVDLLFREIGFSIHKKNHPNFCF